MRFAGISIFLILSFTITGSEDCCPFDQSPCFPSTGYLISFAESLDGKLITPLDGTYVNYTLMKNTWTTKFPLVVVLATSVSDVQKAIIFARKFNLRVTVKGTGHDYNGRSTAHGSLEINLSPMTSKKVNLNSTRSPHGEIELEAGNTWLDVYTEVDRHSRVIIGGSAHTVGMGGYTLGGGHSPMCRMFGMAVDNLLEVEMVSADGNIIRATNGYTHVTRVDGTTKNTTDTDIFWALSGGGGGTFGVVTKFIFKLHPPAPSVVRLYMVYPIILANGTNIGTQIMKQFSELLVNLPREWGGYMMVNGHGPDPTYGTIGSITFFMNHYGGMNTDTRRYMDQMVNFLPSLSIHEYKEYGTFLEYEKTAVDPPYYMTYLFNRLLNSQSFTTEFNEFFIESVLSNPTDKSAVYYTGTLMGGKMMEVSSDGTSVHPGFRNGLMSLTGGIGWDDQTIDVERDGIAQGGNRLGENLARFGDGMYPNESGPQVKHWQDHFWGSNYERLLEIKRQWDPDNFFSCSQCVGSEISRESQTTSSAPYLRSLQLNVLFMTVTAFVLYC